jgi:hypothetical protein
MHVLDVIKQITIQIVLKERNILIAKLIWVTISIIVFC